MRSPDKNRWKSEYIRRLSDVNFNAKRLVIASVEPEIVQSQVFTLATALSRVLLKQLSSALH